MGKGLRIRPTSNHVGIDTETVLAALSLLTDPAHGVEIVASPGWRGSILPAANPHDVLKVVSSLAADATGIYFRVNPVPIDLSWPASSRTTDAHIVARRWFTVEIDAQKDEDHKDSPITEEQYQRVRSLGLRVQSQLFDMGWPAPVEIHSGRGVHLYWRIELANDDIARNLIQKCLQNLDTRHSGRDGKIDTSVYNASRLMRLPGTQNRKGTATEDRPHRWCELVSVPAERRIVTLRELQELAGVVEQASTDTVIDSPPPTSVEREETPSPVPEPSTNGTAHTEDISPCDDFDRRGDWEDILKPYGWTIARHRGDEIHWTRPGKEDRSATSATTGHCQKDGDDLLHIFSDNASPFEANKNYGKSRALSLLMHGGDYAETTRYLREKGYGTPNRSGPKVKVTGTPEPITDEPGNQWAINVDDIEVCAGTNDDLVEKLKARNGGKTIYEIYTLTGLVNRDFPEPKWAIPGILSEGLNILAGRPKLGKSILALNLGITIAGGGYAMKKIKCAPGDVLYLSLEDKHRRVKSRAVKMIPGLSVETSNRLSIATRWPKLGQGGLKLIEWWIKRVERPSLVIIDVWGVFKPVYRQGNTYEQDYQYTGEIKALMDEFGCTGLVLHHCRKSGSDAKDALEEVSGTTGLTGAADGIVVLARTRNESEAQILVTGRDVPEQELSLKFDVNSLTWESLGSASQIVEGKLQKKVLEYLKGRCGMPAFIKEISETIEEPTDSVRKTLHRLQEKGYIRQKGRAWAYPGEESETAGAAGQRDEEAF